MVALTPVVGHGLADAALPVPPLTVQAFAALAVAATVTRLRTRARRPAMRTDARPALPGGAVAAGRWALAGGAVAVVAAGLLGPSDPTLNPASRLLFVVFPAWLGLTSLLAGPLWRALDPLRALSGFLDAGASDAADAGAADAGTADAGGRRPVDLRGAVGVLTVLAVVETMVATPTAAAATVLIYAAFVLAGAVAIGLRAYDRLDALGLYSDVLGLGAPLRRDAEGRLRWHGPCAVLATAAEWPGLRGAVAVLVGHSLFDSVSATEWWLRVSPGAGLPPPVTAAGALLATVGAVYLATRLATAGRPGLAVAFVPVAAGYLAAHWLAPLVHDTPVALAQLVALAVPQLSVTPPQLLEGGPLAAVAAVLLLAGHLAALVAGSDRVPGGAAAAAAQFPFRVVVTASLLAGLAIVV